MSGQVQKEKPEQVKEVAPVEGDAKGLSPESQASVDKATEGMDALLAEIDALLEPNAQAFVDSFIQKGGE